MLRLRLRISRESSYELNNKSLVSRILYYISDKEKDVLIKGYRAVGNLKTGLFILFSPDLSGM